MRTAAILIPLLLLAPARAQEEPAAPTKPSEAGPADSGPAAAPERPRVEIKTSQGLIVVELFPEEAPKTVENFLALVEGTKETKDLKTGKMSKRPFYDGLTFHRIIKGFMLQAGCPLGNGMGNPGYQFADEINADELGLDKLKVMQAGGQPHPWLLIRDQQSFNQTVVLPLCRKLGIANQEDFKKRVAELQAAVAKMTLKECYENLGYKFDGKLKSRKPSKGTLAMANAGPNTNGSQFFINMVDNEHLTGKHTVFGRVVSGMDVAAKIEGVAADRQGRPTTPVKIESMRRVGAKNAAPDAGKTPPPEDADGETAPEKDG